MLFKTFTVERLLLLSMILVSVGLVSLQYKWTNDLAESELAMAEGVLKSQAESLCRVFDQQLNENCLELVPNGNEVSSTGFQAANLNRFLLWQARRPRPLFSRIGIVVPIGDSLKVFEIDQQTRQVLPIASPKKWKPLLANLAKKRNANSLPFNDPSGELIEYPVFGPTGAAAGGPESQWTVMELDLDYLNSTWIPELLRQFLSPEIADAAIKTSHSPFDVIFPPKEKHPHPGLTIPFNNQGHAEGSPLGEKEAAWSLEVWPNAAKLQQAVQRSRYESLFLALVLDGLILFAVYMLVRYTRRARQLGESQMNFVAATSHELRTPLTVIRGAAHNLQRGIVKDPERISEYAGMIAKNAEQLSRMIEQILAYASAQRNRLQLRMVPVNVVSLLHRAIESSRAELVTTNIFLDFAPPEETIIVPGDEPSLVSAFQNIILNAVKHAGSGGWIGIEIRQNLTEKVLEIIFSDRGPGIPEEELEKVFQLFYRGTVTVDQQTRGSGIGLGLVKEIIQSNHGSVTARNRAGGGAEFVVRLPLTQAGTK